MIKNWLIRTKSNHILGPISKAKVTELYKNGSVKPDDEFCSGNGYWFFVKEKALVDRYLLGDENQEFNPISEANDVLSEGNATAVFNLKNLHAHNEKEKEKEKEEELKLPTDDDLDYPDMAPVVAKVAPVSQKATSPVHSDPETAQLPPATPKTQPLAHPEKKSENVTIPPPKRKEVPLKKKDEIHTPPKGSHAQSKKLSMAVVALLVVVIVAVLYQKLVLKKKVVLNSFFIENAEAQISNSDALKKKSTFFPN
ncbi:MAG: hypothetical protein ACOYL6_01875 [Bacteriovoracaceae bacterium]